MYAAAALMMLHPAMLRCDDAAPPQSFRADSGLFSPPAALCIRKEPGLKPRRFIGTGRRGGDTYVSVPRLFLQAFVDTIAPPQYCTEGRMRTCSRLGQSKASRAGRIFKRQEDSHDRAECNASGVYGYTMGFQWSGYTKFSPT